MRKAFVGVTDFDWYEFLAHRTDFSEINFWQPSASTPFRALARGDLFLFKLHTPNNFIVGGGFFEVSSVLPVSIAWEAFALGNGAPSLAVMRERIAKYRREVLKPTADYTIGNIILQQPFFFRREAWIPVPSDFSLNIVRGKTYDLDVGAGLELWSALEERMVAAAIPQLAVADGAARKMFSDPVLARRRLGQGGFRILVTETYGRQCAVTSEHTLPVLEAAHIRPVTQGGEHSVTNGLLFRSDVHRLFDRGYVTVTPDYRFRVSRRLDDDWRNGKIYYQQDNQPIHLPNDPACRPDRDLLEWHAASVFLS